MPSTVRQLFEAVSGELHGPVRWMTPPDLKTANEPGIYVASLSADPDVMTTLASAPIDPLRIGEWLTACPNMTVDGNPARAQSVMDRLSEFWVPDETVLYIGKVEAGKGKRKRTIGKRVDEYFKTPLGASSRHSGGAWLKTLSCLGEISVFWAGHPHPPLAESGMIEAFGEAMSQSSRKGIRDFACPFPFANIRHPDTGRLKDHGLGKTTY